MVELYLNMQNKRKADGVIDIEIAQNPPKNGLYDSFINKLTYCKTNGYNFGTASN